MALINCPNCGRSNVSDSAEKCPECGYNIKAHFEEIKKEQENIEKQKIIEDQRKQKEVEQKTEDEKQIECPECHKLFSAKSSICPNCGLSLDNKENVKRLNEINKLEQVVKNNKSLLIKCTLWILIYIILCIGSSIIFAHLGWDTFTEGIVFFFGLIAFVLLLITAGILYAHFEDESKLKLAKEDYDKYLEQKKEAQIQAELASIEKHQKYLNNAQCPYCHSRNTKKISTASRATSVALVGIASKKIGKQWHCNNCGSDF